jgi:hypothetical protein
LHYQAFAGAIKIRDFVECLPLSPFRALAISRMKQGQIVRLARDRCRDAGVHAPAQQNDRPGFPAHRLK